MIEYFSNLFTKGTAGSFIAIGVHAVAAFILFVQVLLGFSRGTSRSVMRLITVAVSAAAAFLGTRIIGRAFIGARTVASVFPKKSEAIAPLADAPLSELLLPIVFLILFFAFSSLMAIPHKLLCGILGFSYERNNLFTRLFGMVVGLAHGALTALVLLFPLFCLMGQYVHAVKETDVKSGTTAFYESYVKDTTESPMYKYPMEYAGNQILDEFSRCNKDALAEKK